MIIGPASLAEVRAVQLQVLRPRGPLPGDRDPGPGWLHLAARVTGQVVGACSIGPAAWERVDLCELAAPQWQLRSMAVLPEHRGGTGRELLGVAMRVAQEAGAASMWAAARQAAAGLYTGAGWQVVGDRWDKPGVGPHVYVVREQLADPPPA
jgi:GNAT superfamily N-acetyltransferase